MQGGSDKGLKQWRSAPSRCQGLCFHIGFPGINEDVGEVGEIGILRFKSLSLSDVTQT